MTKIIEVKEAINDTKSDFNIKRFDIGTIHSDAPIKTIDSRVVSKSGFEKDKSSFKNIIFEFPKRIDYNAISDVINGNDCFVKRFFGFTDWIDNYNHVISPTFTFNPYIIYKKIEDISGFFKYYYNFSKTFSFIPNVQVRKPVYEIRPNGKKRRMDDEIIISAEQYVKFIDDSFNILSDKNNKPIFVPLSLQFTMSETEQLAKNYISKGYSHIWVDFEAAKTTQYEIISKLSQFYSVFRKAECLDRTVFYITNVKREITANSRKEENPSSDILTTLCGGNFIGINQNPPNPNPASPPMIPEVQQNLWEHTARVFTPETYYYTRRDLANASSEVFNQLLDKQYREFYNTMQLDYEIRNQADQFLTELDIEEYVGNKKMISEGRLRQRLFYKKYGGVQSKLDDDFKMF